MNFDTDKHITSKTIVTEDEMKKMKNGLVYDMGDLTPNLPDIPLLLSQIEEILEYMYDDNILDLKKNNNSKFRQCMEDKFSNFSSRYYGIFDKLLSGGDLTHLYSMFTEIERIKKGEVSLEDAEQVLGEELAKDYIPNKLRSQNCTVEDIKVSDGKRKKRKKREKNKIFAFRILVNFLMFEEVYQFFFDYEILFEWYRLLHSFLYYQILYCLEKID